jgi:predicted nucleic acid-binding protein
LSGASRYYVDTNVVIYILESPTKLSAGQNAFVADLEAGRLEAVTSELTLAECLIKPLGDFDTTAVAAYQTFLNDRRNFPVLPVNRDILVEAAAIRARVRCPLPDAIHLATAVLARCDVLLSNDKRLKPVAPLQILSWNTL